MELLESEVDLLMEKGMLAALFLDDLTTSDAVGFCGGEVLLEVGELGLEEIALVLEGFSRGLELVQFLEAEVDIVMEEGLLATQFLDSLPTSDAVGFRGGEVLLEVCELGLEEIALVEEGFGGRLKLVEFLEAEVDLLVEFRDCGALLFDEFAAQFMVSGQPA